MGRKGTGSSIDPKAFRTLPREKRVDLLVQEGILTKEEGELLKADTPLLPLKIAEHMIENVVGIFPFPLGLVPSVPVNGTLYDVPMVIEEPSVVAAQGNSAKLARKTGGFQAESTEPVMIAQIQLVGIQDPESGRKVLLERKEEIFQLANSFMPGVVRRGGGMRGVEVRLVPVPGRNETMMVVHLRIDTRDAMGANAINTVAEKVAPYLSQWTGGTPILRILSNLSDLRVARVRWEIPVELLSTHSFSGEEVAERIQYASFLAEEDPYRAVTHNKGIMNGVDAVLIATGNDFRAVEAGAHAYAVREGKYRALSRWRVEGSTLVGVLEMPMAVGIVGGQTRSHPLVQIVLKILGVQTARELAELIVSVGLAQNFAALRALVTEGIQKGHMAMHARAVALSVGATPEEVDLVADRLRKDGMITYEYAKKILQEIREKR